MQQEGSWGVFVAGEAVVLNEHIKKGLTKRCYLSRSIKEVRVDIGGRVFQA